MTQEMDSAATRHSQKPPTNAELLGAARRRTREEILKRTARMAVDPRL